MEFVKGQSGSARAWESVTNVAWVRNGVLSRYTSAALGVYKCPADIFLSPSQRKAGFPSRLRSNSMNALIGFSGIGGYNDGDGHAWFDQRYRQFLKQSQIPSPAMTWLTLDEHPDSINDGFFIVPIDPGGWGDIPSSYHCGGCGFSFCDGHAEVHKWKSATSVYPVRYLFASTSFDVVGRTIDYQWYKQRTGYTLFR